MLARDRPRHHRLFSIVAILIDPRRATRTSYDPARRPALLDLPRQALVRQPTSLPHGRCLGPAGSVPAGRWASRQVTPSGPTLAPWTRPGRQLEPIPGPRCQPLPRTGQPERDRTLGYDDHLVVAVIVCPRTRRPDRSTRSGRPGPPRRVARPDRRTSPWRPPVPDLVDARRQRRLGGWVRTRTDFAFGALVAGWARSRA